MPARPADDYDITIPPAMTGPQPVVETMVWSRDDELQPTYESRRNTAWFHTWIAAVLVFMLGAMMVGSGQAPAVDARLGVANLILHFGAWLTGWLALDAALDAWRLHRDELARFGATTSEGLDIQSRTVLVLGMVASAALLLNTVMVVSAIVA